MEHFNKLMPDEAERLAILSEECSEVVQIVCKIQRHGYESSHPDELKITNRMLLEKELGHLKNALGLLNIQGDVSNNNINYHCAEKARRIGQYLHHQNVTTNKIIHRPSR